MLACMLACMCVALVVVRSALLAVFVCVTSTVAGLVLRRQPLAWPACVFVFVLLRHPLAWLGLASLAVCVPRCR